MIHTQRDSGKADTISSAYRVMHSVQTLDGCIIPPQREEVQGDSSPWQVAINLIKCAVGAGSFSLPAAWRTAGFWAALGLTVALGALAALTACMLVACERSMSRQAGRRLTYPELLRLTFPGTQGVALHSVAVGGITCTSVGVCVAYVDFIVGVLTGSLGRSRYEVMALLFPCVLGLALLRSFRYLAFTSILGDVAVLTGLVGTVSFGLAQGASFAPPSALPAVHVGGLPQATGNIAFLFLIHAVLLPIAQSMRPSPPPPATWTCLGRAASARALGADAPGAGDAPPEQGSRAAGQRGSRAAGQQGSDAPPERSFASVAWPSYALITLGNVAFGGVCYSLFADRTAPNVLQNLRSGSSAGVVAIQLLLCVDLLFTIPMVLAAGREICEGYATASRLGSLHEPLTRTLTRLLLVLIIFGAAAAIPSFGDVVTLIGGLSNSLMGLVLPPLLHSPRRLSPVHLISVLGVGLLVSSTYFTVRGMLV